MPCLALKHMPGMADVSSVLLIIINNNTAVIQSHS
jgi:hypothetical protein